jgi:hypothetical protein
VELAVSEDGKTYVPVYRIENKVLPQQLLRHAVRFKKAGIDKEARYLRLTVTNACLSADPLKNGILMDEIVVE